MKKLLLAGAAVAVIAGSTAVYAQHRPWMHHHMQIKPEDRAALADARIAAVKAGLKLTPDQEKLWGPVESAVRDFAKLRIDNANARMEARKDGAEGDTPPNPVERLQKHADAMAASAAAMKKIAEAADPLYKTLDDGQKRRLAFLTRMGPHFGGGHGWHHRGPPPGFGPGGFERGSFNGPGFPPPGDDDGERGPGFGHDDPPGAEHL